MFDFLRRWFGCAKTSPTNEQRPAIRYERLTDIPTKGDALHDKTAVVCRGRQLILTKTAALPERLEPGEVCWIVPKDDVPLTVQVVVDDRTLQADVTLRFEADNNFALFAVGRNQLTKDDLVQLVAGQWAELMTLEHLKSETLVSGSADVLAKFRTHLSVLLQNSGFRCVGIKAVNEVTPSAENPVVPALTQEAATELQAAVSQVKTDAEWETLLDRLDAAGFEPDTKAIAELATLGGDYLSRKISADETTLRIRKMIERKNLEISAIQQETALWNAADVKLRLLESFDGETEKFLLGAADDVSKSARVPSTWYILRKRKIDDKLQKYLRSSTEEMLGLLETVKNRQSDLTAKAKLTGSQATLRRLQDHFAMMPSLVAGQSNLRRRQLDYGELLDAVRRGVGATQLADGLLRKLATETYSSKEYENGVKDLETVLHTLEGELKKRKNVFGV